MGIRDKPIAAGSPWQNGFVERLIGTTPPHSITLERQSASGAGHRTPRTQCRPCDAHFRRASSGSRFWLSVPKTWSALIWRQNRVTSAAMVTLLWFLLRLLASPFKSASRREAENAVLRHQLAVLQRKLGGRVQFTNSDRLFFIQLYRWFPSILKAITIIRPETVVRWHRSGFRHYWRWKSRSPGRFEGADPADER
jgi:hypothetical protein